MEVHPAKFKDIVTAPLIPSEDDLLVRKHFSYSAAPKQVIVKAGDFEELTQEKLIFATRDGLGIPPTQTKFLANTFATKPTASTPQQVPLYQPAELLRTNLDEKNHIMEGPPKQALGKTKTAVAEEFVSTAAEGDPVIRFHGDRHHDTYAEYDNRLRAGVKIRLTVGNGTIAKGSLVSRTRTIGVFRNNLQREKVYEELRAWLLSRVQDARDVRFHRVYSTQGSGSAPREI